VREIRLWAIGGLLALLPGGAASGGIVPDLVDFVEILKGVDRNDGVVMPIEPYFVEICVEGFVNEAPVGTATVTLPGAQQPIAIPLGLANCLEGGFDTQQELDAAYPTGTYLFNFSKGGDTDSLSLAFNETAPQAFPQIISPADEATGVDPDVDLQVSWSLSALSCPPTGSIFDCGDGISLFLGIQVPETEIFDSTNLAIDATSETVPASALEPGIEYELEVETFTGGGSGTNTDMGDPVSTLTLFEDINVTQFTTLPEPGPAALGLVGLGAVGLLAGRRSGERARRA
jgi:hypothetical protein